MSRIRIHSKLDKLKLENRALKETLEIFSDKKILQEIKTSLEEIKEGKTYPLSNL